MKNRFRSVLFVVLAMFTLTSPALAADVGENLSGKENAAIDADGSGFSVPPEMQAKDAELVDLIKNTESMEKTEKQYWFDLYPQMSEQDIARLKGILVEEKKKLDSLDEVYRKELDGLNKKHLEEWNKLVEENK